MRIPFLHIIMSALMVIMIFNYDIKQNTLLSSIKISKLKSDDKYVYIKINLNSLVYIDSVGIKTNNKNENIIVLDNKTRKVSLDYFVDKTKILNDRISLKIYNNGEYKEYVQKIN